MGNGILITACILSLTMAAEPMQYVSADSPQRNEHRAETGIVIRESDEELLKKIATAEAGNQGADGMWLVMSVVMNRLESDNWPDSIKGVIYQKSQFSTIDDGSFDKVKEYPEGCDEALERIKAADVAPQIIGFEYRTSDALDKYFDYVFTYRDHRFYVEKK